MRKILQRFALWVVGIRALELRPGDLMILRISERQTTQGVIACIAHFQTTVAEIQPSARVTVLPEVVRVEIIHCPRAEGAATEGSAS